MIDELKVTVKKVESVCRFTPEGKCNVHAVELVGKGRSSVSLLDMTDDRVVAFKLGQHFKLTFTPLSDEEYDALKARGL